MSVKLFLLILISIRLSTVTKINLNGSEITCINKTKLQSDLKCNKHKI